MKAILIVKLISTLGVNYNVRQKITTCVFYGMTRSQEVDLEKRYIECLKRYLGTNFKPSKIAPNRKMEKI